MRLSAFAVAMAFAVPAAAQAGDAAQGSVEFSSDTGAAAEGLGPAGGGERPGPLVVGLEVGGVFPQPFTELGTHVAVGVEVGYKLPILEEKLEVFLASAYTPPNNSFSVDRADGTYNGEVTQKELTISLGPRYRFMDVANPWNVSAALGGRMFLLSSTSSGDKGGVDFIEYTEESTQWGLFIAAGGEYLLGPGAVLLDIDFGWSDLPHTITGDVNTGNFMVTVGYRLFLL